MEVVRVSNEVNVHVSRGGNWLPTLSPADNLFELWASRLDSTPSVLDFSNFLVCVLLDEVIVTSQHCTSFTREIGPLELCSLLNALTVLVLLLLQVIVIEAGWLFQGDRLVTMCNWWLHTSQCPHQAQVIKLIDILTREWCNRPGVRRLVELWSALLVTWHFHQWVHSVSRCIHRSYRAFIRDSFGRINLKSWHAVKVSCHALWTAKS